MEEAKKTHKRASIMSDGVYGTEGRMVTQNNANIPTHENHFTEDKVIESHRVDEHDGMYHDQTDQNKIGQKGVESKQAVENISESNEYFNKVKAIEILASFWAILQLGNSIIIYEVSYTNDNGEHDGFILQSLAVSTMTSIGLTISIVLRHMTHLKWKKSKNYCLKDETIWSSGYWKLMVAEAFWSLVAPQYFFEGLSYKEYNASYDVHLDYEVNQIMCCFVWIKCYVTVRSLLIVTKFMSPRSQRI